MDQKKFKTLKAAILWGGLSLPLYGFGSVQASGAVDSINNLNRLILNVIGAVGVLAVVVGAVFFIASFSSHDTQQRISGGLAIAAGLLLYFLEDVLEFIGVDVSGGTTASIGPVIVELCSGAAERLGMLLQL